jgi:hypothetical protein
LRLPPLVIPGRRFSSAEFRGDRHPAGELTLILGARGDFRLSLAIWDPVVRVEVCEREIVGRWHRGFRRLELRAPTRRIIYRCASSPARGWIWQMSTLPTFADGIALVPV